MKSKYSRAYLFTYLSIFTFTLLFFQNCGQPFETTSNSSSITDVNSTPGSSFLAPGCTDSNYVLPRWDDPSTVTLNYTIGLGPNAPTVADVVSSYSLTQGTRTITGVNCPNSKDLAFSCTTSRVSVRNGTVNGSPVECASGTAELLAKPDDGCVGKAFPTKKFIINYTSVCPTQQTVKAAQLNASLGSRVALSGNYAVVAAQKYDDTPTGRIDVGATYVFKKDAANTWSFYTRLVPASAQIGDGVAEVAIRDNIIAIGSYRSGGTGLGHVYIYELQQKIEGPTWVETAKIPSPRYPAALTASLIDPINSPSASQYSITDPNDELFFGHRIIISADNSLLVSAYDEDLLIDNQKIVNAGAVYKFDKNDYGNWIFTQKLISPKPKIDGGFGYNTSLDNYHLAISEPVFNDDSLSNYGSVYLYNGLPNSDYTYDKELRLPEASVTSALRFGKGVHIKGDYIAVGAPFKDSQKGGVYIFHRVSGWLGKLTVPTDVAVYDGFGSSLQITDIDSTNKKLTLYAASPGRASKTGAIFKYQISTDSANCAAAKNCSVLKYILRARTAERGSSAEFGKSFDIENNQILVGSPGKLVDEIANAGLGLFINLQTLP